MWLVCKVVLDKGKYLWVYYYIIRINFYYFFLKIGEKIFKMVKLINGKFRYFY